jgi:hypothetical protein
MAGALGLLLGFALAYFVAVEGSAFPFYIVYISGGLCAVLGFMARESFLSAIIEVVIGLIR